MTKFKQLLLIILVFGCETKAINAQTSTNAKTEVFNTLPNDTLSRDVLVDSQAVDNQETFYVYKTNKKASYYGKSHHGKRMANGKKFDMYKLTCAHKTLPFGTKVRITNMDNGKTVIVKVTDRGPFVKNREIDLSKGAYDVITHKSSIGVLNVKIEVLK